MIVAVIRPVKLTTSPAGVPLKSTVIYSQANRQFYTLETAMSSLVCWLYANYESVISDHLSSDRRPGYVSLVSPQRS